MHDPRPLHEWREDIGDVLWWLWPIEQPPYVGTPLDIGRTVSLDVTVQIGYDVYEVAQNKVGDTGGWPWQDADDETQARLYWTPLPDCGDLDRAIRDHIRGGPDPFAEASPAQPVDETERLRSLSDRAAPAPWVVYSEPEVGLFASVFSGTVMQTGFAPVNLDDPANVEFIVEAVNFTRAALRPQEGEVSRG